MSELEFVPNLWMQRIRALHPSPNSNFDMRRRTVIKPVVFLVVNVYQLDLLVNFTEPMLCDFNISIPFTECNQSSLDQCLFQKHNQCWLQHQQRNGSRNNKLLNQNKKVDVTFHEKNNFAPSLSRKRQRSHVRASAYLKNKQRRKPDYETCKHWYHAILISVLNNHKNVSKHVKQFQEAKWKTIFPNSKIISLGVKENDG